MILDVPTSTDPDYSQVVAFDGVPFLMRFRWSERSASWHLDLSTPAGAPILMGIRLVLGARFLRRCRHPLRPRGELFLSDSTGTGAEATQLDFGTRVRLHYKEATP